MDPRSCYDEGKRVCEMLIYEYARAYNLDCKIVRLFNTYGLKMTLDDGRVITNWIGWILEGLSVRIYGSVEQTISFCYITDMLEGLVKMMSSLELGPINLGNDTCEFTLNELVEVFERVLRRKVLVEYLSGKQDDPKVRKPVLDKARDKLNFKCVIGLDEGIRETCNWI